MPLPITNGQIGSGKLLVKHQLCLATGTKHSEEEQETGQGHKFLPKNGHLR